MILVTLGTIELPFERLLKDVEECFYNTDEEIIAQIGHTNYISTRIKTFSFLPFDEMEQLYKKARLIVTHAGVGSIMMGLKLNKKIICVPRLSKYKEHVDDHQLDILNSFTKSGFVLSYLESKLCSRVESLASFSPNKYISNTGNYISLIENILNNSDYKQ